MVTQPTLVSALSTPMVTLLVNFKPFLLTCLHFSTLSSQIVSHEITKTKKIKALIGREESLDEDEILQRIIYYHRHHLWLMIQLGVDEEIYDKYEELANAMYTSGDEDSNEGDEEFEEKEDKN